MHKATFSKLKLWLISMAGVLMLALVVQITTQSASAAPADFEVGESGEVVHITSADGENEMVVDFDAIDGVEAPGNPSVTDLEANMRGVEGWVEDNLGWDLQSAADRAQLLGELERLGTVLAQRDVTGVTGGRTGTDLRQLEQALELLTDTTECRGRCLAPIGSNTQHALILGLLALGGPLALLQVEIEQGRVPRFASNSVFTAVAAITLAASVYWGIQADARERRNGLQQQRERAEDRARIADLENQLAQLTGAQNTAVEEIEEYASATEASLGETSFNTLEQFVSAAASDIHDEVIAEEAEDVLAYDLRKGGEAPPTGGEDEDCTGGDCGEL